MSKTHYQRRIEMYLIKAIFIIALLLMNFGSPSILIAGNALNFDGVDDYVDVPYNANLNPDIFTVSVWAKVEGGSGPFRCVVSSRDYDQYQGYAFYASDSNIWSFWVGSGTSTVFINCEPVALNQWTHLALTYDGSDFIGYVNGKAYQLTSTVSKKMFLG
jgi:hypothetical protein